MFFDNLITVSATRQLSWHGQNCGGEKKARQRRINAGQRPAGSEGGAEFPPNPPSAPP